MGAVCARPSGAGTGNVPGSWAPQARSLIVTIALATMLTEVMPAAACQPMN
jgi:hypothetical protein